MHPVLYSILAIGACLLTGKGIEALVGGLPGSLYGMLIFALALQQELGPTQ